MRILVLGKNGQLAQCFRGIFLKDSSLNPIFLDRFEITISERAIDTLIGKHAPEIVLNCSAYTNVEGAEDDIENARLVNATLPQYLGRSCHKRNIPIIHFSTDYVFDGQKEGPYKPTDLKNPLSVYGKTKSEGEDLLRQETPYCWILRTSWVFSQYGANFFKTMYTLLQTRDTLNIINDQHGAPTAAHAIARAVSDLIKTPSKYPYGIYHITGAGKTSWHGFAVEIQKLMTAAGIKSPTHLCEIATKDYPTKAKRPLNSQLECDIFKLPKWQDFLAEVFNFYESIK